MRVRTLRPAIAASILVVGAAGIAADARPLSASMSAARHVAALSASGRTTVGWGVNASGEVGAGYKSPPLTSPVQGSLRGVRQVATGYKSGFALLSDGTVHAWGGNGYGQLGDGTHYEKINPVRVLGLKHIMQIAVSGAHGMALRDDGTVWTWGSNAYGQLGNGTSEPLEGIGNPVPIRVPGLSGVVAISAGGADDAAILADGTARVWGEDEYGQLGDASKEDKLAPIRLANLTGVRMVAMGGLASLTGHTLVLLGNGTVMVMGDNGHAQLGLGDTTDRLAPTPLPGLSHVSAVSTSATHSLALSSNGNVYSWGRGAEGELGYAAPESCGGVPCGKRPRLARATGVSAISAGFRFSLAISDELVLSWGDNEDGELGDGTLVNHTAPRLPAGIAGIRSISAGEDFALAAGREGPLPNFTVSPVPGGLSAQWAAAPGSEPWALSWRRFSKPRVSWGPPVTLPAAAHSYTITRLRPVLYEVRLKRVGGIGYQIAYGVPE